MPEDTQFRHMSKLETLPLSGEKLESPEEDDSLAEVSRSFSKLAKTQQPKNRSAAEEEPAADNDLGEDAPRRYRIGRELLAGITAEVDPAWVEEETNFATVTGYSVAEFAGLLNCLNASCISARDCPYYAQKEALWEKHAKDFRKLEGEIDAGFFLAAARLGLGETAFAELVAKTEGPGALATVTQRLENCYIMLDCPAVKEYEQSVASNKFTEARATEEQTVISANDFASLGINKKSLAAIVEAVDPLGKGRDAPNYVKGMARLCTYLKAKVNEERLPFKTDATLMVVWRSGCVQNDQLFRNTHLRKWGGAVKYEDRELADLFVIIERIMGSDFDLLCTEHRITVSLPALLERPTAKNLARVYMILAGYNVLRSNGRNYLWYDGSEWWSIYEKERVVANCWDAFKESVASVLSEGARRRNVACEKLAARLNYSALIKQIFDNCKALVPRMKMDAKIEHPHLNEQIQRFLERCCETGREFKIAPHDLFDAYINFCRRGGEVESYSCAATLVKHLAWQDDLFGVAKNHGKRLIVGLGLKAESHTSAEGEISSSGGDARH